MLQQTEPLSYNGFQWYTASPCNKDATWKARVDLQMQHFLTLAEAIEEFAAQVRTLKGKRGVPSGYTGIAAADRLLTAELQKGRVVPKGVRQSRGRLALSICTWVPQLYWQDRQDRQGGRLDLESGGSSDGRWSELRFVQSEIDAAVRRARGGGRPKGSTGSGHNDAEALQFMQAMPAGQRGAAMAAARHVSPAAPIDRLLANAKRLRRKAKAGQSS